MSEVKKQTELKQRTQHNAVIVIIAGIEIKAMLNYHATYVYTHS